MCFNVKNKLEAWCAASGKKIDGGGGGWRCFTDIVWNSVAGVLNLIAYGWVVEHLEDTGQCLIEVTAFFRFSCSTS